MPPKKGSRAAHEGALKAAETRRRNKSLGKYRARYAEEHAENMRDNGQLTPAFPTSYHARPTQHVTRDLRLKQTVKKPKQHRIALKKIRTASTAELEAVYNEMNSGHWEWGRGDDDRYYGIKGELRARASGNAALMYQRIGSRAIGGKKVSKRQQKRVSAKQPRPQKPPKLARSAEAQFTRLGGELERARQERDFSRATELERKIEELGKRQSEDSAWWLFVIRGRNVVRRARKQEEVHY